MSRPRAKQAPAAIFEETELVQRVLAREAGAFRTILQRHNRRLYRIARAVLRDDTEAEDVVQEAYISAFTHLSSYRGESSLGAWLSRITMNEALGRLRYRRRTVDIATLNLKAQPARILAARILALPPSLTRVDNWKMGKTRAHVSPVIGFLCPPGWL